MNVRFATVSVLSIVALTLVPACGDDGDGNGGDTTTTTTTDNDVTTGGDATTTTDPDGTTTADTTTSTSDTSTTPVDTATTPPDTQSDTVVVDPLEGTCPGVLLCLNDDCASLPQAQQQACAQACVGEATQPEAAAFNAFATCMQSNSCIPTSNPPSDAQLKAQAACQRTHCVTQTVACYGGAFAAGTCTQVNQCIAQNCFSGNDLGCIRECMSAGSETAAQRWLNWNLCATAECYDSTATQQEQETCVQQVANQPVCSDEYLECFGPGEGAGTGAGAGGGVPGAARYFGFGAFGQ